MLSLKKNLVAVFCMALLLAGCGSPLNGGDLRFAGSSGEQRAVRLAEKGDYTGAAYLFERQARKQTGEKRIRSLLTAADYYLLGGDTRSARRILQEIGPLDPGKFPLHVVLEADLLLRGGESSAALARLGGAPAGNDSYVDYRYYSTLARIQMARNENDAALNAMLKLDGMNIASSYRLANQRAIVALLAGMTIGKRQQLMNASNRTLAGWAMLADILEHSASPAEKNARLAAWKSSFASHPALRELFESGAAQAGLTGGNIAVLLPMSGVYASASSAIRRGIEVTQAQRGFLMLRENGDLAVQVGAAGLGALLRQQLIGKRAVGVTGGGGLDGTGTGEHWLSEPQAAGVIQNEHFHLAAG